MYKPEMVRTPCVIMRGGTSKAIFLLKNDLPTDPEKRDAFILAVFGSPDSRQIDGLGGADPLTSKLAIISKSDSPDADIDYTFGQVEIKKARVDYSSNCGNISSAVGPFAIQQGLVNAVEPITIVRVRNTNTNKIFVAEVPVQDGIPCVYGAYKVDGVPGTGAKISLNFAGTIGSKTNHLLPTGNPRDTLYIDGFGELTVSMVDAGSPMVFVRATDIGLKGVESPNEVDTNTELLELLEKIRALAAEKMGIVDSWEVAIEKVRAVPMVAFVSPSQNYVSHITHEKVSGDEIDFVSRGMFMGIMHKTYSGTATICTGCAAVTNGTVVQEVMKQKISSGVIRFGHPGGTIEIEMETSKSDSSKVITRAAIGRTSRRIMEGYVYTPRNLFD